MNKKIIVIMVALAMMLTGCTTLTGTQKAQAKISMDEARVLTANFINNNLMEKGTTASIKSVVEENNLYKVTVSMPTGSEIVSYLSTDGKVFFPQAMNIAEYEKKTQATNEANKETPVTKSDKPKLELFVMSFCPYGVQAETALVPVVDLLGDKADIQVRYIASLEGDDLSKVQSLHGPVEGIEDARQLCVAKNYGEDTLWDYIAAINKECYPIYRNGDDVYKACWEKSAKAAGIDVKKINTCLDSEGANLIKAEDAAAGGYGVSGSPTFILNGVRANIARTPEGIKKAICDAFNTPPAECSTVLSGDAAAASGNCN